MTLRAFAQQHAARPAVRDASSPIAKPDTHDPTSNGNRAEISGPAGAMTRDAEG
jgi:hypothetical protein